VYSICKTAYSREFAWPVERKWHGPLSDLITMLNKTLVLPQVLADGSWRGWHFTGGFPLKLHTKFLFRGFLGRNANMAVYRGAL
jgi:hypothetical protein